VYGAAATRETLLGFARRTETLGYDSLWVSDHVVIPWRIASRYPYNASGDFPLPPTGDFLEPLTALALVAGVTDRIALGTSVLVLPHRHPVLAAKMLATLDHLAPGRVICGAGVGWMREEIELLGAPYARRGAWSDEAIRVMRACWTEERAAFAGEFFRFEPVGCRPRPARVPSRSGSAATPSAPSAASWSSATAGTPPSPRTPISATRSHACGRPARKPAAIPPR
jgi:probable F420-dependent oxidoreductase